MKWRAFSRMPQWVRLSEWLGVAVWTVTKPIFFAVPVMRSQVFGADAFS
jgi:hypothetical protein